MTKTTSTLPPGWKGVQSWYSAEELRGAELINKPITLTALREYVAQFDEPEEGYAVMLMVGHGLNDVDEGERRWYVHHIDVFFTDGDAHRKLLWAVPGVGRFTPLVTKRQAQKTYRTLETLVRQFTEIFGRERDLAICLNWEHHLKEGDPARMAGPQEK